ncbi:MAG: hypothetical protein CMB96_03470 [Flavobacteriaceae bacterium]|nr:hypothetical protein [Flavobacteriaceae bacterium]
MERYGNIKGGKVIGVGSFGCVFSPPLPCKEGQKQPTKDMVSKLMESDDAEKEMSEIDRVTERLGQIPNAGRYFGGFDTYICQADSITPDDVRGFNCHVGDVTKLINDTRSPLELPELSILQQKDLGKTVHDYLTTVDSQENLKSFLQNMVNLLNNGIIPMNNLGIYHLDIKSDNVLVNDNLPVLIDWGLSYMTDDSKPIVNAFTRGKIFNPEVTNVPMTAFCMFNEPLVARAFYKTADNVGGMLDFHGLSGASTVRSIIHKLYTSPTESESQHLRYLLGGIINPVIEVMKQDYESQEKQYPFTGSEMLLSHYLSVQRDLYFKDGVVNHNQLYQDFFYNVDIWGWVMTFVPLLKSSISGSNGSLSKFLPDSKRRSIRLMCAKMVEYLFVCDTGKYDVGVIIAFVENVIEIL